MPHGAGILRQIALSHSRVGALRELAQCTAKFLRNAVAAENVA
jgi:hypothetical protein